MPNLVDIPTIVATLLTYVVLGGDAAAFEAFKGVTINGSLKLAELKDDLLTRSDVQPVVARYKDDCNNAHLRAELESLLTSALKQHHTMVAHRSPPATSVHGQAAWPRASIREK